jgi:peptidyl-prolyl cis-trans isomerase B (cyclophilin B)
LKKMFILILAVAFCLSIILGCQAQPKKPAPAKTPEKTKVQTPETGKLGFIIKTAKGNIKGELWPDDAPNTVLNFITLAQKGFYKGLTFHRVEPGFVIQGGDPNGDGSGGPGYGIPGEFNKRPHKLGTLSMARAQDPDSAGSQFFVCIGDAPFLNGKYAAFGKVTEGMPVALSIKPGDKIKDIEITGAIPPSIKNKKLKKTGEK